MGRSASSGRGSTRLNNYKMPRGKCAKTGKRKPETGKRAIPGRGGGGAIAWEIPGHWVSGPGGALFRAARGVAHEELGRQHQVGEALGVAAAALDHEPRGGLAEFFRV